MDSYLAKKLDELNKHSMELNKKIQELVAHIQDDKKGETSLEDHLVHIQNLEKTQANVTAEIIEMLEKMIQAEINK
jgi:predicted RNase H-like nuclease (RuvC/YqgF family)